jgi:hypothetical protein
MTSESPQMTPPRIRERGSGHLHGNLRIDPFLFQYLFSAQEIDVGTITFFYARVTDGLKNPHTGIYDGVVFTGIDTGTQLIIRKHTSNTC